MSMAMKYAMQKRMAKGGSTGCADCAAGVCMAHGGTVEHEKGVNKPYGTHKESGVSKAGEAVRYAKKDPEYASDNKEYAKLEHERVRGELKSMKKPHLYAEGGDVEDDDMVSRIMHEHFTSPGAEANEEEPTADFEGNQFDDLVKEGGMEGDYVGDENLGNEQLDEDEDDVVKRAMRSWAKKDRMPRPA